MQNDGSVLLAAATERHGQDSAPDARTGMEDEGVLAETIPAAEVGGGVWSGVLGLGLTCEPVRSGGLSCDRSVDRDPGIFPASTGEAVLILPSWTSSTFLAMPR
jgi:hypothetical protein